MQHDGDSDDDDGDGDSDDGDDVIAPKKHKKMGGGRMSDTCYECYGN